MSVSDSILIFWNFSDTIFDMEYTCPAKSEQKAVSDVPLILAKYSSLSFEAPQTSPKNIKDSPLYFLGSLNVTGKITDIAIHMHAMELAITMIENIPAKTKNAGAESVDIIRFSSSIINPITAAQ